MMSVYINLLLYVIRLYCLIFIISCKNEENNAEKKSRRKEIHTVRANVAALSVNRVDVMSSGTSLRRAKNIRDTLTRARNFSREEILPSLVKAGSGDEEGSSAARRNRKLEERNFIRVRERSVRRGENVDVCSSRLHLDDCVRCHSI